MSGVATLGMHGRMDQRPTRALNSTFFSKLSPRWSRGCALRTHYERRQALVEIDVLGGQGPRPGHSTNCLRSIVCSFL